MVKLTSALAKEINQRRRSTRIARLKHGIRNLPQYKNKSEKELEQIVLQIVDKKRGKATKAK